MAMRPVSTAAGAAGAAHFTPVASALSAVRTCVFVPTASRTGSVVLRTIKSPFVVTMPSRCVWSSSANSVVAAPIAAVAPTSGGVALAAVGGAALGVALWWLVYRWPPVRDLKFFKAV